MGALPANLPDHVRAGLEELRRALEPLVPAKLAGGAIYGGVAKGKAFSESSDVNLLLILRSGEPGALEAVARPLPFNEESVRAVARNVRAIRPELPCPLILENISTPFVLPGTMWAEPEFVRRVLDAADCGLLLDLHNLHADAVNQGFDAQEALEARRNRVRVG